MKTLILSIGYDLAAKIGRTIKIFIGFAHHEFTLNLNLLFIAMKEIFIKF